MKRNLAVLQMSLVVRMERCSVCSGVPFNDCGFLTFLTATCSLLVCVIDKFTSTICDLMNLDISFPGVHTSLFMRKLYQYFLDAMDLIVWPGFKISLLTGF